MEWDPSFYRRDNSPHIVMVMCGLDGVFKVLSLQKRTTAYSFTQIKSWMRNDVGVVSHVIIVSEVLSHLHVVSSERSGFY